MPQSRPIDPPTSPREAGDLVAARLDAIAAEAGQRSPGTELGLAVWNLDTGEWAAAAGDVPHVSASSAKVVWVAAALDGVGIGPVARHADPIFRLSDNVASGAVIDLVGPDAVNRFYWDRAGMGPATRLSTARAPAIRPRPRDARAAAAG